MLIPIIRALTLAVLVVAGPAMAQTTEVSLGGIRTDPNAPVEITADRLDADQAAGTAIFTGNVVVIQGPMTLAAPRVEVIYEQDGSGTMDSVLASGGVTMTSGTDMAESDDADYAVESGIMVLTGNVLLTQGPTTMAGERLTANLDDGTGVMEGRVAVVIPGRAEDGAGTD